jgi:predicted nucleotidyltransferase
VLKWPDANKVIEALIRLVEKAVRSRNDIINIGYFGSYARGDWGVGSDLDLIIVIKDSTLAFHERPIEWDTMEIPVPVDLLVYTEDEFKNLKSQNRRFFETLEQEAIWLLRNKIT